MRERQDLVLGRHVQVLLQGYLGGGAVQLRLDGDQPARRLIQLSLDRKLFGEGRLIGCSEGRLGRGKIADVVGGQEVFVGGVDARQLVFEGQSLLLDGGGRSVLEHFAAVDQIWSMMAFRTRADFSALSLSKPRPIVDP